MPMLFVVQQGGNFVANANHPEKIVYIACSLQSILDLGLNFYFSDGHATDKLTTFFNSKQINDLTNIIDWKAVKTAYWGGHDNLNIKRKKQAEFLVHEDVPNDCIVGYGSFNEAAKKQLIMVFP